MRFFYEFYSKKKEDDTVTSECKSLDSVFNCSIALLADDMEAAPLDSDAIGNKANNS